MRPAALLDRIERAAAGLGGVDVRIVEPGRSNLAVAPPGAREPDDIAALSGGLLVREGVVRPAGPAAYGADPALARVLLTAIRFEPEVRAVASLRPLPALADTLDAHLRELVRVDPRRAPRGISTMDWAIARTFDGEGMPDAVLVEGEALLLFATTVEEVVDEIIMVSSHASI
ncbi:MAG TPA: thiamine-phosphate synthase family protein [Methanoregulaceae archaeon]|nr:thiamine-phosphate synthase family protein [Methanoregulaceae archaeon]